MFVLGVDQEFVHAAHGPVCGVHVRASPYGQFIWWDLLVLYRDRRWSFRELGEGYQVVSSQSGREAMEQLAKEPCDVMVTDLKMRDMDGVQLTEAVRGTSPAMPVIWLTAYGYEGVQQELERLSVRRCINKPVRTSEIVRAVREALRNASGSGSNEHEKSG